MKLSQRQRQFAKDVARWITWCFDHGHTITLGEVYRTAEQQKWYVEHGLSRTMNSRHRQRLALDFNLIVGDQYVGDSVDYLPLGEAWEAMGEGHIWGGRFTSLQDAGHIELDPEGED